MKHITLTVIGLIMGISVHGQAPVTARQPVTDSYFGRQVTDHYRWLENTIDTAVKQWLKSQADFTKQTMAQISGRDSLVKTLIAYNKLKPYSTGEIIKKGGRYFYKKTLAEEIVGKLYYRTGERGKEVLLYNPVKKDGKSYSINYYLPSEDGKKIAFGISVSGSETSTIYIMNVDTKTLYPEKIFPSWFGLSGWTPDGKGFLYTVQNSGDVADMKSMTDTRSMYHVPGTNPAEDKLIFSRKKYSNLTIEPKDLCFVFYSEDFKYIFGLLGGVGRDINCFYAPATELFKPTINWKRLVEPKDQVTNFVCYGDDIYLLTYAGAPNSKVTKANLKQLDLQSAPIVIPEQPAQIVETVRSKDYLYFVTNDGINSKAFQYNFSRGAAEEITLPVSGTAGVYPMDITSNEVLMGITSWKQPYSIYNYNPGDGTMAPSNWTAKVNYPGVDDIVVEETEIKSHDGTLVPLTIMYKKGLKKDGSAVCMMTGYGAYGSSATPFFSTYSLALLNRGVVVAETHVRGGSEKGENWYKAGFKTTKPNTWKDFIASGEYLISQGYTSAAHLIGEGTSAGGILIGRAITERPDLFAAAISNVSCSNALRMENSPNGLNNTLEFGSVKDSVEANALYEMDAFQHVKEATAYPAVICVGGMNDPRVSVWQPAKFAAALQHASSSGKPVLLSVNYDNGHFTENKEISYRNYAEMYSFALWQAGHPDFKKMN